MKDELREAAEIAGTRAFPAHPHFRGTGAALYIAGYEAGKPKWIPVSERLPEVQNPWPVEVFAAIRLVDKVGHDHWFYESCKFYKGEWTNSGGKLFEDDITRVVAWMPIPPYQQEGE